MARLSNKVIKAIDGMSDKILGCRAFGHAWDEIPAEFAHNPSTYIQGVRIWFRCMRCTSRRIDVWTHTGKFLFRQYKYCKGYSVVGAGRSRAPFRAAYLERTDEKRRSAPRRAAAARGDRRLRRVA